jgi:hypothetical protein
MEWYSNLYDSIQIFCIKSVVLKSLSHNNKHPARLWRFDMKSWSSRGMVLGAEMIVMWCRQS